MGELVSELDQRIWAIHQDQKGNYWFGSNGNGVFHYNGKDLKKYTHKDGLVSNTIRGFQEDTLGHIFIQTPNGVSKYDGKTFTTLSPIISSYNEWKLEPNDLWFNGDGNVYRYDGDSLFGLTLPKVNLKEAFGIEELSYKDRNHGPYDVYVLDKDKKGNLWIGTASSGAFRYDGKSFLWVREKELSTLPDGRVPAVRSIIEDKDGYLWLSNFISKYRITADNSDYEKLIGIDPTNEYIQEMLPYFNSGLRDEKGNLWMTTYSSEVWKYDGNKLFNFPIKNSKTEVLTVSIYQDNNGIFWLGTDNTGVLKFDGENFTSFKPN